MQLLYIIKIHIPSANYYNINITIKQKPEYLTGKITKVCSRVKNTIIS